MIFPHAASQLTTLQVTSNSTPRGIVPPGSIISNRVLLKASAASIFVGGANVTTSIGVPIPTGDTAPYLELWIDDPASLFVVGSGTVYVLIEEPSKVQ